MKRKQITAMITAMTMVLGITACGSGNVSAEQENKEQTEIESTLNISNNDEITWSYDSQSDSWTMSVTCAVANPELPDYQGVSVNVPGAYVKGIDTNGDGKEDITGKTYSEEVNGRLVIDDSAKIANTNGQTYTASTAPVIINTGAAGYGAQENQKASSGNAAMVAATSDNTDYFPYEVEAGAVGIYQNEDGTYSGTIGSEDTEISDGLCRWLDMV